MEHDPQQPALGMLGCDREVFARVWGRVAPGSGEGCPIEVLPPTGAPAPLPAAQPAPPDSAGDRPGCDEPEQGDVPCLGRAGADHAALLQEYICHELADWRTYQALARRATGTAARSLSSMAADERRHARRLSAAFFLISGVRFLPETQPISRPICGLMGSLRERFWEEQHGAAAYLASAEEAADPCLAALYRELAAEEGAHADLLRAMVERM